MDELIKALDDISIVIGMYKRDISTRMQELGHLEQSTINGFGSDSMGVKISSRLSYIRKQLNRALEDADDLYQKVMRSIEYCEAIRDEADGDSQCSKGQKTLRMRRN